MSTRTAIEWTDATWNPIRGCSRVSEGCRNCYAERQAARFSRRANEAFFNVISDGRWNGTVDLAEHKLDEPMHWLPQRIFVNSMSDLFHERVPGSWIQRVFAVIESCPRHTFQILTKRPRYMRAVMTLMYGKKPPLPNVWLGVSIEDQQTANERIPLLLQTPAAVRFVSYEPVLGPVDFTNLPVPNADRPFAFNALDRMDDEHFYNVHEALDWVIAGGESGPGARIAHPDWFRAARNQCLQYSVPFFFKQWGEYAPIGPLYAACDTKQHMHALRFDKNAYQIDRTGAIWADRDGQPPPGTWVVGRFGKKAAGRLLDGREWNDFPATVAYEAAR